MTWELVLVTAANVVLVTRGRRLTEDQMRAIARETVAQFELERALMQRRAAELAMGPDVETREETRQ